jgi:hypothetical protein
MIIIDLRKLAVGMYFVMVYNGDRGFEEKVVIQR